MARVALSLFALVSLQMVLVVWGQMTHAPVIPDFPDPPTFPTIVNMSFVTFIDDPIPIPENIRAEIDCGQVIDQAVMDGGGIANVTWYKNNRPITNNSETNVVIAADNRSMIITDTFRGSPAQVGTEGFYACEVCVVGSNCFNVTRCTDICVPPNLESGSGTVPTAGPARQIMCGQDVVLDSFGFIIFTISCPLFNGTSILCNTSQIDGVRVFKDGVEVPESPTESYRVGPNPVPNEDICGTYTFVLESACGRDVAVSRVTCPGDPPDIDEGPFVPRPDPITPGDKTVQIGTTAYVVGGNDVTIDCNIASGTRPIIITWFRNGVEDPSLENMTTITASNPSDGDMYMCQANNSLGFDEETTMIEVQRDCIVSLDESVNATVQEGGEATIRINVNVEQTSDVDVQILVAGMEPLPMTINANSRAGIQIFAIPDNTVCCDGGNVDLSINASSLPDGCVVGNPDNARVTVMDNDVCTVSFNPSTYRVDEDAGPAQPMLVLNGQSAIDINVQVTDTGNTATNGGVDYDSGPYSTTFNAGGTSASFNVPITDDDVDETDENFNLAIDPSSLPPTCVMVGSPDTATVTIVDDEEPCPVCTPPAIETPRPDPDLCPVCGEWRTGMYGQCSLDCHLGTQRRDVTCFDISMNPAEEVLDGFCDANTKPLDVQNCGSGPCRGTGWSKGPWSMCSRTCQTGYQKRKVECVQMGVVVSDSECEEDNRPRSERFCNAHIKCFPCKDLYPDFCPKLMGTPDCRKMEYMQACCWSCGD